MPLPEIVIVGAARTPIGRYGGSLRTVHPAELGAAAASAAMARAGVSPDAIDEVLIGHGRQAGSGPNPARQVGIKAGIPDTVPAQTINKACASGMQTIATGAQSIMLGEAEVVLAGGIESMSRMPYLIDAEDARWGHKMGHFTLVDAMYRDGFTCSVCGMIMGETVEVLARQYGITREASDAYALESQQRAERAIAAGRFVDEIAPVTFTGREGQADQTLTADEHPRAGTTIESLREAAAGLRTSKAAGIVTAGASSGVTDGGAAVVIMSAAAAKARGLTPLARIIGWASAGVDPRMMGIGPVPAVHKLLKKTGPVARGLRSRRAERSVRRAGARRAEGSADSDGEAQRQRRRDRARPSDRLHRHENRRDAALRDDAAQGAPRPRHAVRVSGGMGMAMGLANCADD